MTIEKFERAAALQSEIKSLRSDFEKVRKTDERDSDNEFNLLRGIAALSLDRLIQHAVREFNDL